jgi:hypothetical protein
MPLAWRMQPQKWSVRNVVGRYDTAVPWGNSHSYGNPVLVAMARGTKLQHPNRSQHS